ncbi:MAG: sensor domain-containing phosphodiesterase [Maritimibacter sp.]
MHSLLEDASSIETNQTAGAVSHLRWVLDHIRSTLDMDVVFISRFRGGKREIDHVSMSPSVAEFRIEPGMTSPLEQSLCWRIAKGKLPTVMHNTRRTDGAKDIAAVHVLGVGGHLGVPIQDANRETVGMLCCFSQQERPELTEKHAQFMGHFSALVSIDLNILDESRRHFDKRTAELRAVIETGQFSPVFQPVFDLQNASIHYLEGLTRMSPNLGANVTTVLDLARAHDMGFEMELAFAERIMQAAAQEAGEMRVGVNLSEKALMSDEFLRFLARHDHRGTVLELTEHEPVLNESRLLERVAQARRHGAKLALDDTGGGFSSLHNILALRPDILKIDKSIAEDIETDRLVSHLIRHLHGYCSEVGAELVVEGVERPGQLATLHKIGVRFAQGYLLGRPTAQLDRETSEVTGAQVLRRAVS